MGEQVSQVSQECNGGVSLVCPPPICCPLIGQLDLIRLLWWGRGQSGNQVCKWCLCHLPSPCRYVHRAVGIIWLLGWGRNCSRQQECKWCLGLSPHPAGSLTGQLLSALRISTCNGSPRPYLGICNPFNFHNYRLPSSGRLTWLRFYFFFF